MQRQEMEIEDGPEEKHGLFTEKKRGVRLPKGIPSNRFARKKSTSPFLPDIPLRLSLPYHSIVHSSDCSVITLFTASLKP